MYNFKTPLLQIAGLCALAFTFSCQVEEGIPEVTESLEIINEEFDEGFVLEELPEESENHRLGNWNIIHEETFDGEPFQAYVHQQFAREHSFRKVNNPSLKGNFSGRFELRKGDPMVTRVGIRAEVLFQQPSHKERWYSFGLFLPSSGFARDRDNDVLSQWHQNIGSPAASFRVQNDRFILRMMDSRGNLELNDLGPATKNTWNEFVFHFIHSTGSDGLIEIWQNDKKIISRKGSNMHSGALPNWKIGLYKPTWQVRSTDTNTRIAFFDMIRIGNENAKFEEMKPSVANTKGWGPKVHDIEGFRLINAHTNKILGNMSDGAIISIAELKTNRISILANTDKDFSGSVKFELSGPRNAVRFDNASPYSLFGGNGRGIFYNEGGLPKGNYTLKVTPFDERNGRGKEGKTETIKFTVTNQGSSSLNNSSGIQTQTNQSGSYIDGFTLIRANTNTLHGSLNNGDVLDTDELGTNKLAIKVTTHEDFDGFVRFVLKGPVNRNSTATEAPYTLFNYENGNYSFGGVGLPNGNYTLEAIPVIDGEVVDGESKQISFRIK